MPALLLTWLAPCALGWVTVRLYLLIPSLFETLEEKVLEHETFCL
jgi:hypothetical protein